MIPPVYSLLSADAGVTGLISTRIFQGHRPPTATLQGDLPCVTFSVLDGAPFQYQDREIGIDRVRTRIDCWAADPDTVRSIVEATRAALEGSGHVVAYLGNRFNEDVRQFSAAFDWEWFG